MVAVTTMALMSVLLCFTGRTGVAIRWLLGSVPLLLLGGGLGHEGSSGRCRQPSGVLTSTLGRRRQIGSATSLSRVGAHTGGQGRRTGRSYA